MSFNAKLLAQDAASWYLSHLDPYTPHSENIKKFLRCPLLAVTLNALHSSRLDPAGGATTTQEEQEEEEKKSSNGNTTSGDWREYLQGQQLWTEQGQETYDKLSRRTKARIEAFLTGCALAVDSECVLTTTSPSPVASPIKLALRRSKKPPTSFPARTTSDVDLQDGLAYENKDGTPDSSTGTDAPKSSSTLPTSLIGQISQSSSGPVIEHPQIPEEELVIRLELYIRSLYRVRTLQEECVVAMEPPRAIKARARYITSASIATAGCVRSMRPVLTQLLNFLTKELLAVETLSEPLAKVIRKIVSEYEHNTSFASLAFLSSPEVSADSRLTPLITKYLKYLQCEWEGLVQECELERMLSRTLDAPMRTIFKTIEFRSIGHLLEVCQEYRQKLHNIELGPQKVSDGQDVNALCNSPIALRQAIRDLQREIITVNGHVLAPVTSRKELIHLLSQTLNSRALTAEPKKMNHRQKLHSYRRTESCPGKMSRESGTPSESSIPAAAQPTPGSPMPMPMQRQGSELEDSMVFSTSECDSSEQENEESEIPSKKRGKRQRFQLSTIDLLTRRLLIAASRTGMGGDAYFVVRDLFGGEDVAVVPSTSLPTMGRMVRPGTIDILVRLSSVTIKCHASFDVYPTALVGECEPLIQFHTTTTEIISLQEVRSGDSSDNGTADDGSSESSSEDPPKRPVMVVQERQTPKTGWRTISIRPALYEKVEEVWNATS
jgi:hypothetical protein